MSRRGSKEPIQGVIEVVRAGQVSLPVVEKTDVTHFAAESKLQPG